jgi:hypothetical protein
MIDEKLGNTMLMYLLLCMFRVKLVIYNHYIIMSNKEWSYIYEFILSFPYIFWFLFRNITQRNTGS